MDRAAGENDLAAAEFLHLAIDERLHADAARAFEQEFLDLCVGRDRQVCTFAYVAIEIAHRGGDAVLVLVRMRDRKITVSEFAILVRQERHPGELAGLSDGERMPGPVLSRDAANRDAAVLAVIGAVAIEVVLDFPEKRQHVVPAPACSATRFPVGIIGWSTAIGELPVDGGAAAEDARLLVFAERRAHFRIVVA